MAAFGGAGGPQKLPRGFGNRADARPANELGVAACLYSLSLVEAGASEYTAARKHLEGRSGRPSQLASQGRA